jgi:hypothetical protein
MKKRLVTPVFILAGFGVVIGLTLIGTRGERTLAHLTLQKPAEKHRAFPVVESNAPEPSDPDTRARQQRRSKHYDRYSSQVIIEAPHISERVWSPDWADGLPAIPVNEQSDSIIVGRVSSAAAHLSNDKRAIYSEFNIEVQDWLKGSSRSSNIVNAERFGGTVRFPSGSLMTYRTEGQGMPMVGRRYLLFLKAIDDGAFTIVTGYDIDGDTVIPLDGSTAADGSRQYVFDRYEGYDSSVLLTQVRSKISAVSQQ